MLNIAICDDEKNFLRDLKIEIELILLSQKWDASIDLFDSGAKMLQNCRNKKYDLVFLDIDMPEVGGFHIAEKISSDEVLLVFCTNHNELVYHSFAYQPFWFLCKDNYKRNLEEVMLEARRKISLRNQYYKFHIRGAIHCINIADILFFDVYKHKINVHMKDDEILEYRDNLAHVESEFQNFGFVRVNSGCLVNMLWIKHILQSDVILKNKLAIPLSRGRRMEVKQRFHEYMRLKG